MTEAINSSITAGVFPNKAKRGIVTPLDKGVFSKIYEPAMKNQMVSFLEYKLSHRTVPNMLIMSETMLISKKWNSDIVSSIH